MLRWKVAKAVAAAVENASKAAKQSDLSSSIAGSSIQILADH